MPDSRKPDHQRVAEICADVVRNRRKKKSYKAGREYDSLITQLKREIGLSRDQALYFAKDMAQLRIRDIDPGLVKTRGLQELPVIVPRRRRQRSGDEPSE